MYKKSAKLSLSISFIGAGRVSTALGLYFKKNNFEITGYLSRSEVNSRQAASQTGSRAFTELRELLGRSDIIWITTPDDKIEEVANRIATLPVTDKNKKLILHASGVHTAALLEPTKKAGYHIAAAHPLLAFDSADDAVKMLAQTWFAVEESTFPISGILHKCGNKTFTVNRDKKILYHAAACVLSNYMVTLIDASQRIFEHAGLSKQDAMHAMQPLLESVIKNLENKQSRDALTGPIKRGDAETVKMHLDALNKSLPEMFELYKLLGQKTMQMINDYKLKDILD